MRVSLLSVEFLPTEAILIDPCPEETEASDGKRGLSFLVQKLMIRTCSTADSSKPQVANR